MPKSDFQQRKKLGVHSSRSRWYIRPYNKYDAERYVLNWTPSFTASPVSSNPATNIENRQGKRSFASRETTDMSVKRQSIIIETLGLEPAVGKLDRSPRSHRLGRREHAKFGRPTTAGEASRIGLAQESPQVIYARSRCFRGTGRILLSNLSKVSIWDFKASKTFISFVYEPLHMVRNLNCRCKFLQTQNKSTTISTQFLSGA